MSLYGALFAGVSGLAAQSSAMGAISDNITNVNTIGYKGTKVNFQTLVTKQTSLTAYSPGGVQSKPRAGIDIQGLLQATSSATDIGLSGQGFFVVNEAAHPQDGDMFAYTRAGSFKVDSEGYLQNVSGWFMQGWTLMGWDNSTQASKVTVGNDVYMKAYKDDSGDTSYINDNIVSATHLRPLNMNEVGGTASQTRNLRMGANLPNGAEVGDLFKQPVTIYDSLGGDATVQFTWEKIAQNRWDVEGIPPEGAKSMHLKKDSSTIYSAMGRLDFNGLPQTTGSMTMAINGTTYTFETDTGTDGATAGTFYTNPSSAANTGAFVDSLAADVNKAFQLEYNSLYNDVGAAIGAGNLLNISVNGTTYNFNSAAELDGLTAASAATALNSNTTFSSLGLKAANQGNRLYVYSEDAMSFTMLGTSTGDFASWTNSSTTTTAAVPVTKTTDGITYAERLAGTNSMIFRQRDATDDLVVAGLDTLDLSDGNPATKQGQDITNSDTFTVSAINITGGTSEDAIEFNGDGTPKEINVAYADIDWANGSEDMSGTDSIGVFLGNLNLSDGMTQLNGAYQLAYWSQNGAKFGNFAGVSIGTDGIVTALFDNGVTRPVFQIPVATFVNPNGMDSLTGNVFISTDNSGEPTLRTAGSAGAGSVNAASLEASTVDIGSEFTTMIVTQRAYSAAAKIITTADEMLDELVNIKR
ncbi:Flagellar hook protein FlgE [Magnetospirillum sp. LM-5]|uniref:flagellar hook-basal body complex protein n=1 Tax=Magnetospirillum sp. LM-5 TaxID=2681466 RepID=UPI00137EDF5E|nr:flagellar hook-basal body complex protein [Magnetospirillum sp. LM-5]CAA7624771.1 Flagellar hook protein FlgE [Magnetospirillum sp. LM-5]